MKVKPMVIVRRAKAAFSLRLEKYVSHKISSPGRVRLPERQASNIVLLLSFFTHPGRMCSVMLMLRTYLTRCVGNRLVWLSSRTTRSASFRSPQTQIEHFSLGPQDNGIGQSDGCPWSSLIIHRLRLSFISSSLLYANQWLGG